MSPWNIVSKFRSKVPLQAPKSAQEPASEPTEGASFTIVSDEVRTAESDPMTHAMEPHHERVVVRVTAHQVSAESSAVDEQYTTPHVATKSEGLGDAHQVSEGALPINNPQPTYDLRTKGKTAKASRVNLKSARARASAKLIQHLRDDERGGYVTEAASLDQDIKHLTAALAEKLEAQNDQLRAMLSRFDGR